MKFFAPLRSWLRATLRHENFLLRAHKASRPSRDTFARKFSPLLVTRHSSLASRSSL